MSRQFSSSSCCYVVTSWKDNVEWLLAAMLLDGLLLDVRRVPQGFSNGRSKDPSPKRLMRHGMFSLPGIVLLFVSFLSRSGKTLCARAPTYCTCLLCSACLRPQPLFLMGSLILSCAKSLHSNTWLNRCVAGEILRLSSSVPFSPTSAYLLLALTCPSMRGICI